MMVESIDMIERIWAQDPPYEFKGEYWSFAIQHAINQELGIGYHAEAAPQLAARRSAFRSPARIPRPPTLPACEAGGRSRAA